MIWIFSDGMGGAYICGYEARAQRINVSGEFTWQSDGVVIPYPDDDIAEFDSVLLDSEGGMINQLPAMSTWGIAICLAGLGLLLSRRL